MPFSLSLIGPVSAQIPVTDAAALAQNALNWAKQVQDMIQQYEEMQRHWDKMDEMQKLQTGTRALGISNVSGIHGQIPDDINQIYSGSYGDTASIMDSERMDKAGSAEIDD